MQPILLEKLVSTRKICVDTINSCCHSSGMSIHSRIKERRLAMGLNSHQALADLLNVSWQTIQLWEKEGGTAPNRSRLPLVAKVLKVSEEWLVSGKGDLGGNEKSRSVDSRNSRDSSGEAVAPDDFIDPDELVALISLYRNSTRDGRSHILEVAGLAEKIG